MYIHGWSTLLYRTRRHTITRVHPFVEYSLWYLPHVGSNTAAIIYLMRWVNEEKRNPAGQACAAGRLWTISLSRVFSRIIGRLFRLRAQCQGRSSAIQSHTVAHWLARSSVFFVCQNDIFANTQKRPVHTLARARKRTVPTVGTGSFPLETSIGDSKCF